MPRPRSITASASAGLIISEGMPRALCVDELPRIIDDFVLAARRAMAAGFDGVELHGANGYLFEQFINGALNTRDDAWGGSIDNRLRLLLDTLDGLSAEVGAHRVAVRISPFGRLYYMQPFEDEYRTWLALAAALKDRQLAYVHTSDQLTLGRRRSRRALPARSARPIAAPWFLPAVLTATVPGRSIHVGGPCRRQPMMQSCSSSCSRCAGVPCRAR